MRSVFAALAVVALVAAVPGILFFGLPPILTAVTGAVLIVPMFWWAQRIAARERATLAG